MQLMLNRLTLILKIVYHNFIQMNNFYFANKFLFFFKKYNFKQNTTKFFIKIFLFNSVLATLFKES